MSMNKKFDQQVNAIIQQIRNQDGCLRLCAFPLSTEYVGNDIHFPQFFINTRYYILLHPVKLGEEHMINIYYTILGNEAFIIPFVDGKQVDYVVKKKHSLWGANLKIPPIDIDLYMHINMRGKYSAIFDHCKERFIDFELYSYEQDGDKL